MLKEAIRLNQTKLYDSLQMLKQKKQTNRLFGDSKGPVMRKQLKARLFWGRTFLSSSQRGDGYSWGVHALPGRGICLFPGGYVSIPQTQSISPTVVGVIDGWGDKSSKSKWWFLEDFSKFHPENWGRWFPILTNRYFFKGVGSITNSIWIHFWSRKSQLIRFVIWKLIQDGCHNYYSPLKRSHLYNYH